MNILKLNKLVIKGGHPEDLVMFILSFSISFSLSNTLKHIFILILAINETLKYKAHNTELVKPGIYNYRCPRV